MEIPIVREHGGRRWIVAAIAMTPFWFLPLGLLWVTMTWVLTL